MARSRPARKTSSARRAVAGGRDHSDNTTKPTRAGVSNQPVVLPLAAEELVIGKQKRETGRVRVRVEPEVRHERVDVSLVEDEVEVQRVPINRIIDKPVPVRQEGDVTIVPVFEEVLVVQKKLVLKEEVHIVRRARKRSQAQQIALRRENVKITRIPTDP